MTAKQEIWADCIECEYYRENDSIPSCIKFDLVGLPDKYTIGTNRKCCSLFSTKRKKYNIPIKSMMEEGVLYFYSTESPNKLIEDIDL